MSNATENGLCESLDSGLVLDTSEKGGDIGCRDVEVVYCPVCTLPSEYCEFGGTWNDCQKLQQENTSEETSQGTTNKPATIEQHKIIFSVHKRGKHKLVTIVTGMDLFLTAPSTKKKTRSDLCNEKKEIDVKLVEISKELKKFLSCGCSVEDGILEIQGDAIDRLLVEIPKRYGEKYGITKDKLNIGKREKFR
ncbi:translation initiation factor SUI1 [Perkinsela sp. CCAP 1560/4]|nr:translation initiation factor SUI1 [Perkinsela sp. CCAP 1560/4]|eukprot:KNH06992.1 translation initiation factor SUI1 [Perkinsela sp. CCAP 1560/4]